jgi:ligand-binding sensor domain-containing protein
MSATICSSWQSRRERDGLLRLFLGCFAGLLLLPLSTTASEVPEVQEDPAPIQLPVVDGKQMRFSRLSTEDGLSQTRVAQITQDGQGYIWFGTQYGLNRYDGHKFKVFVHDPERTNSLGGVFISSLFKDHTGAIWSSCSQDLDKFDPRTETFTHYRIASADSEVLSGTVVHISEDRTGKLWLATGAGLHQLDPASEQVQHYRHDPNDPTSLSSNDVKSSGEDRLGNFWVGTSEGLDRFDRTTGQVTLHVPLHEPVQISFFEDRSGVFWILSATGR